MRMLPNRPLTDIDLRKFTQSVPHFRGIFMRNSLPKLPHTTECGIINLDSKEGGGTHWVAYYKNKNHIEYFDSFGNLHPPVEVVVYFRRGERGGGKTKTNIEYNYYPEQKYNTFNCGHLCLKFLYTITKTRSPSTSH